MRKYIDYVLVILFVSSFATGCKLEEEDVFSSTSAVRTITAEKEYKATLSAAPNGWVMDYFATTESEGYSFLMKFDSSELVTIAASNKYTGSVYKTENSFFNVIADNGPVLTFDTYNSLFHQFSNPENPDGTGLGGDYEFIVMKCDSDLVSLKGKKRGTYIRLRKMDKTQNWADYFKMLDAMHSSLFNAANTDMILTIDNKTAYTLKNGSGHIFSATPAGGSLTDAVTSPFVITNYGLRLQTALKAGEANVQDFQLSEDKTELVCKDSGVNAKITLPAAPTLFANILNNKKYMIFTVSDDHMSADIKAAFSSVTAAMTKSSRKLEYVGFTYSSDWGVSLAVNSSKGSSKVEGFISFAMTIDESNALVLASKGFQGTFDKNGQNYYNNFALSSLVPLLEDQFVLTHIGGMSSTQLRFVSKTNNNKWFDLIIK